MIEEILKPYIENRCNELADDCDNEEDENYKKFMSLLIEENVSGSTLYELEHLYNSIKYKVIKAVYPVALKDGIIISNKMMEFMKK
ncbi:hypothetical protein BVG16_13870 [Paenibacillus selenitireducens]|uniref:Uncharacterized protein n=1 Tax=Paenibacillus selenitireducens TaxID=1324314 RepID=A0A1T2XD39_9BACL|nr:hypothetical protein [Paenibacillus selenitireducens]OPA77533.1 hypothetical protein BVG16_13870 [Paenibacillus selenitireducens]